MTWKKKNVIMTHVSFSSVNFVLVVVTFFILGQQQSHYASGTWPEERFKRAVNKQQQANLAAFKQQLRNGGPPNASQYIKFTDHVFQQGFHRTKHPFCYTKPECGPKSWTKDCSVGYYQSPLDLDPKTSTERKLDGNLKFNEAYKTPMKKFLMTNNGHTILIQHNAEGTSKAEVCIQDRKDCYVFSQVHFHWSNKNGKGSEHTLQKKEFPMEFHMIHYKKKYKNLGEAFLASDVHAVAVFGVLVKLGSANPSFEHVTNGVTKNHLIPTDGLLSASGSITLYDLLPTNQAFFRYSGSLTVPPCTEKILWTVFQNPIEISKNQIGMFHRVFAPNEVDNIMNNFRPVQRASGRLIEYFS